VLKRLLWTALVLVMLAGAGTWWWLRSPIPPLDGEITAIGLHAPVEVLFDAAAVPHVYARDVEDAWFAAGVMHARDRLWQMELYRRATMGRLSEVLGESTLPIDRRMLLLGLREAAAAELKRTQPPLRAALERYADGVNSVVLSQVTRRQRPVELQMLGITPAHWTPLDSLAVGRLLSWRLAENHQSELVRAALASKLGVDAARELGGRYPLNAPTVIESRADPGTESPAGEADPTRAASPIDKAGPNSGPSSWPSGLNWLRPMARRGNSNNWVLAPARTATGRPMLANDPHLQIEFPSVWYEMHLVAAGLDVIGVTIPGVPFVIIGHNARVAWGFTNSGADVQDLYIERLDLARKRYMGASGWQAADVTRVEIPVRGRNTPEPFEIWRTPRGPIYAERDALDFDDLPSWMTPGQSSAAEPELNTATVIAYALRWDSGSGDSAAAFEQFNRATDWATFSAAVDLFAEPSQNIVYADADGNIGYALNGRLPTRLAGDGTFPTDAGAAGAGRGAPVEGAALPRVFNPVAGFITSSNNAIERRDSPFITRDWGGAFRATRLHDALSTDSAATLESMEALQNDRRSLAAAQVLAGVEGALAKANSSDDNSAAVDTLNRLAEWNRIVDGRPIVTLYQAFEDALWRRTFSDDMAEPLFRAFYEWAGSDRPSGLYVILDNARSRWWDDIGTVETRETRDDIYVLAAADADRRLRGDFGSEADQAWDRVHAARFVHPLGRASMALAWFLDGGTSPIDGDGTTVMRSSWNRLDPFHAFEIPTWRQILDVGNWDDSRVILPTGQSGHLLSPHRFDQNEQWRTGQYRRQPYTRTAVEASRAHRLILVP
jgi:penicillin amidase